MILLIIIYAFMAGGVFANEVRLTQKFWQSAAISLLWPVLIIVMIIAAVCCRFRGK